MKNEAFVFRFYSRKTKRVRFLQNSVLVPPISERTNDRTKEKKKHEGNNQFGSSFMLHDHLVKRPHFQQFQTDSIYIHRRNRDASSLSSAEGNCTFSTQEYAGNTGQLLMIVSATICDFFQSPARVESVLCVKCLFCQSNPSF